MAIWEDVTRLGLALPETEATTSYRTPALKVKGKLFARLRSEDDGGVMLACSLEAREAYLQSGEPAFYTTPHYDRYGAILIHLDRIDDDLLRELVEEAWWYRATATLRKRWDASNPR